MKIRENVPLSTLTTMRLGGPARFLIEVESRADIPEAYNFAKSYGLPVSIIGGGANTIAHDEGFPGVLIKNVMTGIFSQNDASTGDGPGGGSPLSASEMGKEKGRQDPSRITIMGGTVWDDAVSYACKQNLTGIEALSKIPGLAAAAPVQNIGAYGQDISKVLISIEAYDTTTGQIVTLSKDDLHFSYRKSILNSTAKGRYFVISITLELKPGHMERPFYNSIEKYIDEHHETVFTPINIRKIVSAIRKSKLPDPATIASAGSFFKNIYLTDDEATAAEMRGIPVYRGIDGNKINSGWLIEQVGLKGQLIHGIRVCDQAALVLINESAKSYTDLAAARDYIIDQVYQKFGYRLEQEPVELVNGR